MQNQKSFKTLIILLSKNLAAIFVSLLIIFTFIVIAWYSAAASGAGLGSIVITIIAWGAGIAAASYVLKLLTQSPYLIAAATLGSSSYIAIRWIRPATDISQTTLGVSAPAGNVLMGLLFILSAVPMALAIKLIFDFGYKEISYVAIIFVLPFIFISETLLKHHVTSNALQEQIALATDLEFTVYAASPLKNTMLSGVKIKETYALGKKSNYLELYFDTAPELNRRDSSFSIFQTKISDKYNPPDDCGWHDSERYSISKYVPKTCEKIGSVDGVCEVYRIKRSPVDVQYNAPRDETAYCGTQTTLISVETGVGTLNNEDLVAIFNSLKPLHGENLTEFIKTHAR